MLNRYVLKIRILESVSVTKHRRGHATVIVPIIYSYILCNNFYLKQTGQGESHRGSRRKAPRNEVCNNLYNL